MSLRGSPAASSVSGGRRARLVAIGLLLGVGWTLTAFAAGFPSGAVVVAPVKDAITPVIADHLEEGVRRAEDGGATAFVVELDTPGGLDTSMRDIVQTFLASRVPVVVHVAPAGARAASAGAIIAYASHVAAMAPGTAIGAATPIDIQGGDLGDKIVNDAAAYAEALAKLRGRDVGFAVDMVRKGRSAPADEALRVGVIDLIARDRTALLERLDGRSVTLGSGEKATIRTAGAAVDLYELRGFRRVLQWLADPNLAFLFLSLGTLAILYEIANPGVGAGGIAGAIMIVLALFSLSVLPVNAIGGLLMLLAAAMFVGEVLTPGVGVFAAGGTAALLLGGVFLFRGSVGVDAAVLYPVAGVAGGTSALIARFAWKTRSLPKSTGGEGLVGATGVVRTAEGDEAHVFVQGALWRARVRDGAPLETGVHVRVVEVDGLDLIVEREGRQ